MPNFLRKLKILEVSACKTPANQESHIVLHKSRDFEIITILKSVFSDELDCSLVYESVERLFGLHIPFRNAVESVMHNTSITDKKAAIREVVREYADELRSRIDSGKFEKSTAGGDNTKGVDPMETYTKEQLDAAIKEAVDKALKDKDKQIQKKDAELEELKILAKLTDVERTYLNSLPKEQRSDFLTKSAEERSAIIKKAKDDDEAFEMGGRIVRKSVVGEDMFEIFKAQNKELVEQRESLKKEREEKERMQFAKRAEELYPNVPGEPSVKGEVLKAIESMPEKIKESALEILKSCNESLATIMKVSGSVGNNGTSSAIEKLDKKARELSLEKSISYERAYAQYLETPEGRSLYNDSLKN